MAGELLIQVLDIGRFRAIRPALDELDAGRRLGRESQRSSPSLCAQYSASRRTIPRAKATMVVG